MVSAEGGQPGTNTSTETTSCTGQTRSRSLGTISVGTPEPMVTFSQYARSVTAFTPKEFLMPGTLAVTAQSPSDTRIFVRARTSLILCRSSSLLTDPSTKVMSTDSGKILASTSGL